MHDLIVMGGGWPLCCPQLALATGKGRLYLWCPSGASWLDLPNATATPSTAMDVKRVRWDPAHGQALLLLTSTHFCTCTLPTE